MILYFLTSDDPTGEEEKRYPYLNQEKVDFIRNYLKQTPQPKEQTKEVDSHSVTTETSDSGIGSKSTPSEVGTEGTSGKLKALKYRKQ